MTAKVFNSSDPNGKGIHEAGAKVDAGKPRPHLVLGSFARALMAVTEVGTFGANKYSDRGWLEVPAGIDRYKEAGLRHMLLADGGRSYDDESLLLHKAHEAWNALAVLELMLRNGSNLREDLYE